MVVKKGERGERERYERQVDWLNHFLSGPSLKTCRIAMFLILEAKKDDLQTKNK